MLQPSEAHRQEKYWRILREGEVSPYKIAVVIFIRESYIHVELRRGSPEERCAQVRLMHQLITGYDISFPELKAVIEDPKNAVRPEILKRFNKVLQNLEEVNASFFYELVHSVIDVESSQTNILRKRITKTSPIGKFLRVVLLNLRKMTYPQSLYLYQQFVAYLQPTIEFKKPCWRSSHHHHHGGSLDTPKGNNKLETFIPTPIKKEVVDDVAQENIPMQQQQETPQLDNKPQQLQQGLEKPECSKNVLSVIKISKQGGDKRRKKGLDIFFNMVQNRRRNSHLGLSMNLASHYEYERLKAKGQLVPENEETFRQGVLEKQERVRKALENVKSLRSAWNPQKPAAVSLLEMSTTSLSDISPDSSFQPKRQRQRVTPKKGAKSPRKAVSLPNEVHCIAQSEINYFPSSDGDDSIESPQQSPTSQVPPSSTTSPRVLRERERRSLDLKRKIVMDVSPEIEIGKPGATELVGIPASERWKDIKYWSRKQIEHTIKFLAAELYHAKGKRYTPSNISAFVEAIMYNPSAQVLLPQLHYLEYLNGLRLKDLTRCTESLRTSFDLRIKPNTSELNKGIPYAAYNLAVFYYLMGFKKDALRYLEEAFQAGHGAADATCLHYCHNLWCTFHGKSYTEAIMKGKKDADRHMGYLYSLNVIGSAFDYHYQGLPAEEIIHSLWQYNSNDVEEIESALILALGSFFSGFGWHDMIAFACQTVLYSELQWPTRAYCSALCLLAQTVLLEGGVHLATEMMKYGDQLFGFEFSQAGHIFGCYNALFKAMKAFLGQKPVDEDVVATISAYSTGEELFWRAYNKMVYNDWEESEKYLKRLHELRSTDPLEMTCEKINLRLRSLLLQAELNCMCGKPTTALKFLFEALELAHSRSSDHYISLCLIDIASIQSELGLLKSASWTLHQELRAKSRSSSPILLAKQNLATVKLRLMYSTPISQSTQNHYALLLDEAQEIFQRWDNNYRLEQIAYLKKKLTHVCGGAMDVDDDTELEHEDDLSSVTITSEGEVAYPSHLVFNPTTCLM